MIFQWGTSCLRLTVDNQADDDDDMDVFGVEVKAMRLRVIDLK